MKLFEILQEYGADVKDIKCELGNKLDGELALNQYYINFDKDLDNISDEDLYQIGRILFPAPGSKNLVFKEDFTQAMKELIRENKAKLEAKNT